MALRRLTELTSAPFYWPIAASLLFVGLGDAVSGPYVALFLTDKAELGPVALGSLLTVRAIASIAIGFAFGRWFDRAPSTTPLFLALGSGVAGYVILAFTTNYFVLMALVAVPMATAASAFPQLFALSKGHLDTRGASLAESGVSLLRALWSVAWAAGPAVGAAIIIPFDFRGVFLATAAFAAASIAIVGFSGIRARVNAVSTSPPRDSWLRAIRSAGFAALALTLVWTAMFMGSVALSISVTHTMGGTKQDVGHAFSLCAFLEVIVMMGFVIRPVNTESRAWMSAGFAAFVIYFATIAVAPSVDIVLAAQAIRAVAIGIVGCLGIGYCQAILRGRVGGATALFANSVNAGALLAGLGTGTWAEAFGYQSMFGACAGLSGLGLLLLQFQPRTSPPGPDNDH